MIENAEGISPVQRLTRRWFIAARVAAALMALVSLVAMAGWGFDLVYFRRAPMDAGVMNPLTSAEYLLAGLGILLLTLEKWPRVWRWTVRVAGSVVALAAMVRILGISGPWGDRIDYGMFHTLVERSQQSVPSLMPMPIAVELVLVGVLLVLLTMRLGRWDSLLALPALGISIAPMLVVIGHLNGVASLSGMGSTAPMSLLAAVGMIGLSAALICVDSGLYWKRQGETDAAGDPTSDSASHAMERKVSVGFAAALVVMTLIGAASYKALEQLQDDSRWDDRTRENLTLVANVEAALMEADVSSRGFVLSGDEAWRKRYDASASSIAPMVQQLRKRMNDNSVQQDRLTGLCPLVGRKLQGLRRTIEVRKREGLESANRMMTGEDQSITDGIHKQLAAMAETERGLLAARLKAAARSAKITIGIIAVGSGVGLGLIGLAGWMIHRDIASRRRAEQELREAKATAEAASRAKSEFLAHMSHEIRTPLNGVLGMTDLILGTELGEQQRRYGLLAKSSAESLTSVINDILDFSKIEAGKLEIVAHEFNLHTAVGDVMDVMAQAARRKGLELACHIGSGVPSLVCGDSARMRQIMINLVNNAIKFTRSGGVIVRLTLETNADAPVVEREATIQTLLAPLPDEKAEEKNTIKVRFSVTDTGIGIPPDRIDRLFKAFSQADASTTRVYGGTGLGLVITKQLAGLLGGEVGVESEQDKGSTFWFTAQFELNEDSEVAQSRLREAMWASSRSAKRDPRSIRVLIVDENPVQRDALHEQVEGWGLTATTATDAAQALTLLEGAIEEKTPYNVAIVDCDMPGMEAPEFARAVRANRRIADTVLMTLLSVDTRVDMEKLRANGFSGYLSKPVRQGDLFKAIMDSIAVGKQDAGPAPSEPLAMGSYFPARSEEGAAPRVLLAEDNEVNRIVATEILRKAGYRFETAVNGKAALDAVKKEYFDLVLMDCQMPVMDGFEATREIRAWERGGPTENRRTIPIIALTANAMKGDRERCLQAGMDAYTSKPIDPKNLLSTMKDLLNREAALRAAA